MNSYQDLRSQPTERNSTELRPIIRHNSASSIKLRDKKRSEPVVRYSKSVYEPNSENEPLISIQKSISNDHIVIGPTKLSAPIDIPKAFQPQSSVNTSDSVPKVSPRLGSVESWSKLFKPTSQPRLSDINELESTPETSTFVSPDSFDNISLESLHDRYGKGVKITKPNKK